MKNTIKSISLLLIMALSITSCILDDDNLADTFNDGPNFTSFSTLNQSVSAVADGNIVTANVNVELQGPKIDNFKGDVTLSIGVNAAETTAIEGVHYTLNATNLTLKAENNYIGTLPISIITDGIDPPLAVAPILTLTFTDTNGSNVISSSKDSTLTLIYQCFADLSGTYLVTNDWCAPSKTTTITKNADGSWRFGTADGYWLDSCTGNAGLFNGGNIVELCGEILATGNLDYGTAGGLGIGDILGGTWDAENGIITMSHKETFFNGGPRAWTSTYTRQ